jgi:hypothetical protein
MATNADIAARTAAIAQELAAFDHLPTVRAVFIYADSIHLSVDGAWRTFEAAIKLAEWARYMGAMVSIEARWVTEGRIHTVIPFQSGDVEMSTSMSTAMAYELGRRLQIALPERGAIEVTAENLLAVLAADEQKASA